MAVNVRTWSQFTCSTVGCGIVVSPKHLGEHGVDKAVQQWYAAAGGRCFAHWYANLSTASKRALRREPGSGIALV